MGVLKYSLCILIVVLIELVVGDSMFVCVLIFIVCVVLVVWFVIDILVIDVIDVSVLL